MSTNGTNRGGRPSLETLQGVRAAMADVLRKLRRKKVEIGQANALINGYTQLAHLLQDARDNRYKKQVKVLWEAHQRGQTVHSEGEPGVQ